MVRITIISIFAIFLSLGAFANSVEPTYRCECMQLVPFESFGIYAVAKLGNEEDWMQIDRRQYSDMQECRLAILKNEICQSLP